MEVILIFLAIYLLFISIELVPIIKAKKYKIFAIYAVLLVVSFGAEVGVAMNWNVPSVSMSIVKIVEKIMY